MSDFENEEGNEDECGFEDGDNMFVAGITFDELTIIGAWMEQDIYQMKKNSQRNNKLSYLMSLLFLSNKIIKSEISD